MRRSVHPLLNLAFIRYRVRGMYALFSGGDDSLVATYIASLHPRFSGVLHIDTQTGIPETRQFVEDTCSLYRWPLTIETPDSLGYRDLVLSGHRTKDGRLLRGFPDGLTSHNTMYYYLKQRSLQRFVRNKKRIHNDHIALVTGVRIGESVRRMRSVLSQPIRNHGAMVFLNPILKWSKQDCLRYLEEHNISRNPVSINLHRSGECLCGALASPHELDEIGFFYPEVVGRIRALEKEVKAAGISNSRWGGYKRGKGYSIRGGSKILCTSCHDSGS